MTMNVDMPDVLECEVTQCAYNKHAQCHARAITVGEGIHAACDTFFPAATHIRNVSQTAGVGACKVAECQHNEDLECHAEAIRVGRHDNHADCVTFRRRST